MFREQYDISSLVDFFFLIFQYFCPKGQKTEIMPKKNKKKSLISVFCPFGQKYWNAREKKSASEEICIICINTGAVFHCQIQHEREHGLENSHLNKFQNLLLPEGGEGGGIEIIRDAHSLYLPGDILRFPLLVKCGL